MTPPLVRRCVCALLAAALLAGCGDEAPQPPQPADSGDPVERAARADVRRHLSSLAGYRGPTTGPPAQPAAPVVFVAADITNGGIAGVAQGVQDAARVIGWPLRVLDGQASPAGRARALRRALALRPGGIVLGGFNADEHPRLLRRARAAGIPVVGWHAGPRPGPAGDLSTNVTTDPADVARLAARYVIADSRGRAQAVLFTDPQFAIALAKARIMAAELRRCLRCSVLRTVETPIATTQQRMPAIVGRLLERYGSRLSYLIGINGAYAAGGRVALADAGRSGTAPPYWVAAGDGDAAEFARIRTGDYQRASVAEPLFLQGWQLVDELNRARAGRPPSGYVPPPRLITRAGVPDGGVFDPPTDYRARYRRIWGR